MGEGVFLEVGEGGLMAVENHNCSGKHHFLLSLALAFDLYGAKNHTKCNKILQRDEIKSIFFSSFCKFELSDVQ